MDKNKLLIIGAMILGLVVIVSTAGSFFIDRVADRVIQKILEEPGAYSPYGPRADPGKYPFQNIQNPSQVAGLNEFRAVITDEQIQPNWSDKWNGKRK